jgi:hypothetical protein
MPPDAELIRAAADRAGALTPALDRLLSDPGELEQLIEELSWGEDACLDSLVPESETKAVLKTVFSRAVLTASLR